MERLTGFSFDLRSKIEADLVRLGRGAEPEDWELAALGHALRSWRIYEAFRRMHEEGWCPGLLFRLSTKTDLLTLCDPETDSSADGFTERTKKVLAKRGIDHRFKWREARRLVAAMGLLDQPPSDGAPTLNPVGYSEMKRDYSTEAASRAGAAPQSAFSEKVGPACSQLKEGALCGSPRPELEAVKRESALAIAQSESDGLPEPRLGRTWMALPTYKKTQLEGVQKRLGCGLWAQFAERFSPSLKKPEMLSYVQRLVRFYANLDAVHLLTETQVEALFKWMQSRLHERGQRDPDLRVAARLYGDFVACASQDALSPAAWSRYRDAEIRRIGAFCYYLFYADSVRD